MDWFGNGSILIGTYPFDTTVLIRRELSELGMNSTDLEFMAAYSEGVVGMRKAWWLSGAVLTVSSLYEAGLLQMEAAAARAEAAAALEMASHELPGLVDATVTPAADQALLPIFRVRDGKFQALIRSNGGTGPVRWTNIEGPPSTAVHGNSLLAMGPHDVYAVRSAMDQTAKGGGQVSAGQVLHFGETGRGWETRGNEWARYLRQKYGLESFAEPLRTVEGKAAGKTTETKYIDYYEKVFGKKPGFEDASGNWVKIQKTRH